MTLTFTATRSAAETHLVALLGDSRMISASSADQTVWIEEALGYLGLTAAAVGSLWDDLVNWFKGRIGGPLSGLIDAFEDWWDSNFGDLIWGTITGPFPFPASWGSGTGPGM